MGISSFNPSPARHLKSLHSIIESLLNQFYNKYSQDTIYIKNCEESVSYIFSSTPRDISRVKKNSLHPRCKARCLHSLIYFNSGVEGGGGVEVEQWVEAEQWIEGEEGGHRVDIVEKFTRIRVCGSGDLNLYPGRFFCIS
jgi:hypothetical protein